MVLFINLNFNLKYFAVIICLYTKLLINYKFNFNQASFLVY